ncbi:site-2 protease family protein [candidate division KSB3 bacterium]|uniref:Site-2 protease family protein n=1 Tax=candidate division KSB3 bacterium TaxID=2044937 RepID=A0A9D5Q507_9BACT|nr:site-2 protease family protein [candidate division KSB3 bacterium]MBD3323757.1 site-2 protease family protein [candidate division KSB3 bacterium]
MNERFRFRPSDPIDIDYEVRQEAAPAERPRRSRFHKYRTNILLFIATFVTTTLAGTMMEAEPGISFLSQWYKGLPFSLTLLTILLFHEFGHYFMAKKHRVDATLPYFIPAPSIIGTFGAVIKMRSPLYSKRSLLDIGSAGPLAGVVIAIPATIIGLKLSEVRVVPDVQQGISLGSSLLFSFLSWLSVGVIPENSDIFLHPIAFAGWIGMLVTMLNLLPIGQLDGGHIAYAVLGKQWHRRASYVILPGLLLLGFIAWPGWLLWCALLFFVMGTKHPPTLDEHIELNRGRKLIGWIALILFIFTFTPAPFNLGL